MKSVEKFWEGRIEKEAIPEIRQKVLAFLSRKGRVLWTESGQLGKSIWDGTVNDDAETMKGLEGAVLAHVNERGSLSWAG